MGSGRGRVDLVRTTVLVAVLVSACRDKAEHAVAAPARTADQASAAVPPSAAASARTAASAVPSRSASASVAPTSTASGVSARPALDAWLVDEWTGRARVYSRVEHDHQTYDAHRIELAIAANGTAAMKISQGNTPSGHLEGIDSRCEASGQLTQYERGVTFMTETSTCPSAKPGQEATVKLDRVGDCLVQWNVTTGRMPYGLKQVAFRRAHCIAR